MPAKSLKIPAALLSRYQAGELDVTGLSRQLHQDQQAVLAELRRLGIDTRLSSRRSLATARRKGYRDHAEMHGKVCALYSADHNLRQVAKETGLTVERARQILLWHGAKLRQRGTVSPARCPPPERLDPKDFARRLRSLRTGAGLSQGALAAGCGLKQSTVSLLERARTRPTWATLDKLARALGCGVEALGLRGAS
jgi:DNA-binding XRE family transcriptional regulator